MTKMLYSKLKSIPVYLETTPKVQNSSFINSNIATKEKVLLMPGCPNRIFAGNRKYPKYPKPVNP